MNAPPPQDPSFLLHHQLLPHLHLVSDYKYAQVARVSVENALQLLLQAPQIVRELRPVYWAYLPPPADGHMMLTWQPPRMINNFASDGYAWLDEEQTYRQSIQGYVIEILVHRAGYVLGSEQFAAHQRTRYHIIEKDPSLPATIDPSLWIVHYGPADPNVRQPVGGAPLHETTRGQLQQRQFLEQQGVQLQKKDFMLMDRQNWPSINGNMVIQQRQVHPAYPPNPMMGRRPPQPPYGQAGPYAQAPLQQPPQKRAKIDRGVAQAIQKNEIPDFLFEEDTEHGDYFDTLTPAEISKMRYKQHHEWMEEIFSSVYSMSQILPEDLGLGLTGSLKELTDGILNTPDPAAVIAPFDPAKNDGDSQAVALRQQANGDSSYRKLSSEKMDEFEKRIAAFVEKGKAETEAMKKKHAETVARFNKSKTYTKAERRLRDASANEIDGIIHEVETSLSAKIVDNKPKVCVEEGGLQKDKPRATNGSASQGTPANGFGGNSTVESLFDGADNSAANLLEEFGGGGSYTHSPATRIATPGMSQPQSAAPTPAAGGALASEQPAPPPADLATVEEEPAESGMDLLEGMDMDVSMDGLDEHQDATSEPTKSGAEDDWVMVGDGANDTAQQPTTTAEATSAPTEPAPATTAPPSTSTPNEAGGMFGAEFDGTFDGLDTGGDGLDFDGGDDLGLGAFDGAFDAGEGDAGA